MAFDKKGSYQFESLEKKYSKFISPTFNIKVGKKELDNAKVPVSSLQVELSAENKAGSCSFTIEAMYDYESGEWANGLLKTLDVGQSVKVEAGYADAQKLIFQGYVDKVSIQYSGHGAPRLRVTALDGLGLLMSVKEKIDFGKKETRKVVEELLAPVKSSGLVSSIAVADVLNLDRQLVKEEEVSTYDFLCQLAEMNFVNFCIIGDALLFSKLMDNTSNLITLTMGENLMEFSKVVALSSNMVSQVTVTSTGNTETQEGIQGTATSPSQYGSGGKSAAQKWAALKGATRDICMNELTTAEECQKMAQNILDSMSLGLVQGSGRCIGIPEIIPGRYITVVGMDESTDDAYFITAVTHSFTEEGYFTEFEVKGFRS